MPSPNHKKKLLVFLSHANEDKPMIRELCQRLKDEGFDPWLDEERILPGQDWQLEIELALKKSDAILVNFSKKSLVKEGYIQREYKKALDYQKEKPEGTIFVIPVRLDDCMIPFFLRELQCVDYPSGYKRLLISLNVRAGKAISTKKPSSPNPQTISLDTTKDDRHEGDIKHVQLVLEGNFEEFNETRKFDLVSVLASILRVDAEAIRILQVYSGSINIVVAMPKIAANRLSEFATNGDFRLRAKGIFSVQVENEQLILLSDVQQTNTGLNNIRGRSERRPFVSGRSVRGKEFIGRQYEIASVLNRARNRESTAIVGQPHIGKTSFLLKLTETKIHEDYFGDTETFIQYIDLHPIEDDYTPLHFWRDATTKLRLSRSKELVALYHQASERNYGRQELESLFDFMGRNDSQLILLLDEFETLFRKANFKNSSFFALMRSLASRTGGLSIVIATRLPLSKINEDGRLFLDLGSPFFNYMIEHHLKPFEDSEIETLLLRAEIPFSDIEKKFIRSVAGRNPFLLQTLAQAVVENQGKENLKYAAEKFYERVASHYDDLWQNLNEKEKTVSIILALMDLKGYAVGKNYSYGEIENTAEFDTELKQLEKYGLAERTGSGARIDLEHALIWRGERWTITGKGFTWWARDYIVAQSRPIPTFDTWLKKKEKKLLLTYEMWEELMTSLKNLPEWAKQGVSGLTEALIKSIIH